MIPQHIINKAMRAMHHGTGQHLGAVFEDTPGWYRSGLEDDAIAALEAVAADIWDEAVIESCVAACGCLRARLVPNPYDASESA